MPSERNIGTLERWTRELGGTLAVLAGLALLLTTAHFLLPATLVLVLLGFDLTLTRITGYCPMCGLLGKSSAGPRHRRAST
jgi:hypothetical protein